MTGSEKVFKVAGLGEVLWDAFPEGEKFGGAPANFCCHCKLLGAEAYVISCVGDDRRGKQACAFLEKYGVDISGIAVSGEHETGVVVVTLDSEGKPDYEIKEGVAWDHIPCNGAIENIAASMDAICFGSLSQRNSVSRDTVRKFLAATGPACLRVFDINLRQDFYSNEIIRESLEQSNALKLNDDELPVVAGIYGLDGPEEKVARSLMDICGLKLISVTRGDKGALMATPDSLSDFPGLKADVVDTVGAGDSFTAAMIMGFLAGDDLDKINETANRVAASVCSHAGAVPESL